MKTQPYIKEIIMDTTVETTTDAPTEPSLAKEVATEIVKSAAIVVASNVLAVGTLYVASKLVKIVRDRRVEKNLAKLETTETTPQD